MNTYRHNAFCMRDIWYARKGCKTNPDNPWRKKIRRGIVLLLLFNRIIT